MKAGLCGAVQSWLYIRLVHNRLGNTIGSFRHVRVCRRLGIWYVLMSDELVKCEISRVFVYREIGCVSTVAQRLELGSNMVMVWSSLAKLQTTLSVSISKGRPSRILYAGLQITWIWT